jgi:flagellar motor protein MotB
MKYRWQERQRGLPSHSDDWLLTYADMITLLLCFFAVFLTVSVAKKDTPHKEPVQQMAEAPPTPTAVAKQEVKPPDLMLAVFENNAPFRTLEPNDFPVQKHASEDDANKAVAASSVEPSKVIDPSPATESAPTVQEVVAPSAPPTVNAPAVSPREDANVEKLRNYGNVEQSGDRITTLEISSAAFFDSGSAVITAAGQGILRGVAVQLKSDQYKDYLITVEGHTDDTPISTPQFPSNWELSTARASAVVHFFLNQGISAQKLRAAGYADTFPKRPNRAADGKAIPSDQAQNRRVVIKLEKIEKAKDMRALGVER